MPTLTYTGRLVVETCWCGTRHAIPSELADMAEQNGHTVYCPLGHQWVVGKSEVIALREQLKEERRRGQAERDLRADAERRLTAQKGETTKAKKRAAAALCPCCNRSFVQLRRHMASQHPDFEAKA